MSNRLLPYGSADSSALVSKVGNPKVGSACLMIYGSDRNAALISKQGTAKAQGTVPGTRTERVVRLNARK